MRTAGQQSFCSICTLTGVLTKARVRMVRNAGFGYAEFLLVPTPPKPWPQSGFQLAATWLRRGWTGGTAFTMHNRALTNSEDTP